MQAGDVEGFASVAFPIVRRVFGNLIANDLVSVQPMSLPSGLIFFMDFMFSPTTTPRLSALGKTSLYGDRLGAELTGGVRLTDAQSELGFYNLNNGYASPTGSSAVRIEGLLSGTFGGVASDSLLGPEIGTVAQGQTLTKLCRFDADFTSGSTTVAVGKVAVSDLAEGGATLNKDNLAAVVVSSSYSGDGQFGTNKHQVRRLTQYSGSTTTHLLVFAVSEGGDESAAQLSSSLCDSVNSLKFPLSDTFASGRNTDLGAVRGADQWGLEAEETIPEIDIKVDSIAVTAVTKKLKAKWTPELGQDLNAYHNLDAEVELTSILSEQIALEIDREILNDLVSGAKAGTYYWSRSPGLFVKRDTGLEIGASAAAPDFTGTVSEWYETLIETINDVSAQIHRKTLRGGANFLVCSPEVANILEFTSGFRANVTADVDKGTVGAVKAGSISKKWDVIVDPYFLRNVILVGRKGGSFLESGYVYAPYVPLQVTPTIFGVEDFVPRKGVMTRYAKKMVRPDMYGLVVVRGMLGEFGN